MNFFFLLLLPTLAFAFPSKDFQFEQSLKIILQNASMPDVRPGMVVASPSKENPNYYYDWVRDTALTARAMIDLWELTKEARLKEMISQWVESEILRQNTPSLSGLGEPKFNIDEENKKIYLEVMSKMTKVLHDELESVSDEMVIKKKNKFTF